MMKKIIAALLFGGGMLCAAAHAGFTPVSLTPHAGEKNHTDIFEDYYSPGVTWSALGARVDINGAPLDFTNGQLQAIRVEDDTEPGPHSITTGAEFPFHINGDEDWYGPAIYEFNAVAGYAAYSQIFGYDLDGDTEGFIHLMDIAGWGNSVTGSATLELEFGQSVAWNRTGEGSLQSSRQLMGDLLDNMVTYKIIDPNDDTPRFMLFWEDLGENENTDQDYNDLVVEMTATFVPEPMSLTMLLLSGSALLRRRRR